MDGGVDQGPRFQERVGGGVEQIRIFVVSNVYKKKEKWRFLKDALWGGEGVPTRAGLVDGGVNQGPWFQDKGSRKGWRWGKGSGGGPRASVLGGRW